MEVVDYIIVGSGCTGAMVAETLCNNGKEVLMIDVGIKGNSDINPSEDFISLRRNSDNQRQILLGAQLEALSALAHPNVPQQTPQRKFMTSFTNKFVPVVSKNFFPVESLAAGGLGNGWGLGAYTFSGAELLRTGSNVEDIRKAYHVVANRIGISGSLNDDASAYCNSVNLTLQTPTELNTPAAGLYNRYQHKKEKFNEEGLFMGRPSLALLTEERLDRAAYRYHDLDFYYNDGKSAYRPNVTTEPLIKQGKLISKTGLLVIKFTETDEYTEVECIETQSAMTVFFKTRKLILASGTLGTARIVLRSFNAAHKLPVLCNAYTYMPFVYWPFLGKKNNERLCGYAQLALFYDRCRDHSDVAMASIYNYRSLLYFRILQQMPLDYADGLKILRLLVPALFIAGIFHPADYNAENYIRLENSNDSFTKDQLYANYVYSTTESKKIRDTERQISKVITSLNCTVLKKVNTLTGASIHYAGTLPFNKHEEKFSLSPDGKLYGARSVFVADGSGFKYLPGKGLTLSLMAYAHSVAEKALRNV